MSEFVNYNKRSVTLPKGCKDLADLRRAGAKPPSAYTPSLASPGKPRAKFEILNESETVAGLDQLGSYLDMVFRSTAANCSLAIISGDDDVAIVVGRQEGEGLGSWVSFRHTPERER